MKAILITCDNQIQTVELSQPLYKSIGTLVGGYIEVVRPMNMKSPYVFICNEYYRTLDLPLNWLGSYFYGTQIHGYPVCGNIVIMKEHDEDLTGLDDAEIQIVTESCSSLLNKAKLL